MFWHVSEACSVSLLNRDLLCCSLIFKTQPKCHFLLEISDQGFCVAFAVPGHPDVPLHTSHRALLSSFCSPSWTYSGKGRHVL